MTYFVQYACDCGYKVEPKKVPVAMYNALKKHSDVKESTWGGHPLLIAPNKCRFCT